MCKEYYKNVSWNDFLKKIKLRLNNVEKMHVYEFTHEPTNTNNYEGYNLVKNNEIEKHLSSFQKNHFFYFCNESNFGTKGFRNTSNYLGENLNDFDEYIRMFFIATFRTLERDVEGKNHKICGELLDKALQSKNEYLLAYYAYQSTRIIPDHNVAYDILSLIDLENKELLILSFVNYFIYINQNYSLLHYSITNDGDKNEL